MKENLNKYYSAVFSKFVHNPCQKESIRSLISGSGIIIPDPNKPKMFRIRPESDPQPTVLLLRVTRLESQAAKYVLRQISFIYKSIRSQEWQKKSVLRIRIRIRIHMFLGLPDPDPLVRGMDPDPALDPDPDPSIIMQK